jgi:tRNA(adenine34) deaminase
MTVDHAYFMNRALQEALKAADEGEVPIGACIVQNATIVGRGYNRMEGLNDATAHAEVVAISAAATALESWRLNGCTLYVTVEPCLMCLGAILQSRIDVIVYGTLDHRLGAIETHPYRPVAAQAYGRFPDCIGGVLAQECQGLVQSFFQNMRKKN